MTKLIVAVVVGCFSLLLSAFLKGRSKQKILTTPKKNPVLSKKFKDRLSKIVGKK